MGWTSLHRTPGLSDQAFFESELPTTLTVRGEILACSTVRNVFYAAVRDKASGEIWALVVLLRRGRGEYNFSYKDIAESSGPVEDHCPAKILDLLTALPDCAHAEEYCRHCGSLIVGAGDQWLSEALPGQVPEVAGPRCYSGYPSGLAGPDGKAPFHRPGGTPPCSTCWARSWRARCRANVQRATDLKARAAAVRPGTAVRFSAPLKFGNGEEHRVLVFEKGSVFRAVGSPYRYRIRRWRTEYDFTVLSAGTETGAEALGEEPSSGALSDGPRPPSPS